MPPAPPPTFDSVVLAAVAQEICRRLPLRVLRVDPGEAHEVVLHTDRGVLLLSADPTWARVHFVRHRPPHPSPSPVVDLLRARLVGARLVDVHQPPFERVLELHLQAADGAYRLVAEPIPKHANLLLVHDGRVVGLARPAAAARSRLRPLAPGSPYQPPPADPRPKPGEAGAGDLLNCLQRAAQPVWKGLLGCVAGVGPLLAYELAGRTGDPEASRCEPERAEALARLLDELQERVVAGRFDPRVYGPEQAPVAFAPFPYACLQHLPAAPASMSEAVERVAGPRSEAARLEARRQALLGRIRAMLQRKSTAVEQVQAELAEAGQADRLREWGTLLLAYAHQVPRGVPSARLAGYQGETVEIPLDPARGPVEKAQELFRRARKLQAASQTLPQRLRSLQQELQALEDLQVQAECARTHEELDEVEAELAGSRPRRAPPARAGPRTFTVDGFTVLVGRSNRENERVTFEMAGPQDLWFHARGIPGAHVVLKTAGRAPSEQTLERVAAVAAYYSAARTATSVDVDCTERRWVRKLAGAAPGRVTYRAERTLRVRPELPEDR
ncbi:MAG: NFACT RNA binding domain-containing protein [Armatimonadota bacterium]|nr:NFACT family protein [Armatimonadota bacterium]MDW8156886.1 NFACT RNA binding domain-containing protein [Armatimonadota bacterium]